MASKKSARIQERRATERNLNDINDNEQVTRTTKTKAVRRGGVPSNPRRSEAPAPSAPCQARIDEAQSSHHGENVVARSAAATAGATAGASARGAAKTHLEPLLERELKWREKKNSPHRPPPSLT